MAGLGDEVEFEDAIGVASFMVLMGRVPPASRWVESLIVMGQDRANESFSENVM